MGSKGLLAVAGERRQIIDYLLDLLNAEFLYSNISATISPKFGAAGFLISKSARISAPSCQRPMLMQHSSNRYFWISCLTPLRRWTDKAIWILSLNIVQRTVGSLLKVTILAQVFCRKWEEGFSTYFLPPKKRPNSVVISLVVTVPSKSITYAVSDAIKTSIK